MGSLSQGHTGITFSSLQFFSFTRCRGTLFLVGREDGQGRPALTALKHCHDALKNNSKELAFEIQS